MLIALIYVQSRLQHSALRPGADRPICLSNTAGTASHSAFAAVQCFGERTPGEDIQEADIISAIEFDRDGMHLATGDRGGRVVLFERTPLAPVRAAAPNVVYGAPQRGCCNAHEHQFLCRGRLSMRVRRQDMSRVHLQVGSRLVISRGLMIGLYAEAGAH